MYCLDGEVSVLAFSHPLCSGDCVSMRSSETPDNCASRKDNLGKVTEHVRQIMTFACNMHIDREGNTSDAPCGTSKKIPGEI